MWNAGLDDAEAGIKIAGRNINNLRYTDNTIHSGTKELPDESERGQWKSWLKPQHSKNENHGIWSHHFMANRCGNNGNSDRLYSLGLQSHCRRWLQSWNYKRHLLPGRKVMTNLDNISKSRDIILPTLFCHYFAKGPCSQGYGFSSSQVWMWDLDYKENWAPKNWCFWTVVLEKTLESPLNFSPS